MQIPAIRASRRLGLRVIVADANDRAPGIELADEFLHIDLKDRAGLAAAAADLKSRTGLDAVFTAGTDFSSSVSWVAQEVGLPGTPFDAAMRATDKAVMREALDQAGINVPRYASFTERELESTTSANLESRLALPVVVKPVDSMGARGVVRADEWDDVLRLARDAVAYSRTGRAIIEEYIDGPEFSLDALVYGTEVRVTGIADRHIEYPPYFIEIGHTIPTQIDRDLRARIEREFAVAVRALGLGPGAAKGDIKWSHGKVVIGEIAARLSGGYMSGWTYPFSSGVTLTEHAIKLALGEPLGRLSEPFERTSAERAVLSIPGLVAEVLGLESARELAEVEAVFQTRFPGDPVVFPRNNVEKASNIISASDSRDSAIASAEAGVSAVLVRLRPGNEETDRFLFGTAEEASADGRNGAYSAYPWASVLEGSGTAPRRHASEMGPVTLWAPDEAADRDWSYRTASQSVEVARRATHRELLLRSGSVPTDPTELYYSRALARGGAQGLVYALDSA